MPPHVMESYAMINAADMPDMPLSYSELNMHSVQGRDFLGQLPLTIRLLRLTSLGMGKNMVLPRQYTPQPGLDMLFQARSRTALPP